MLEQKLYNRIAGVAKNITPENICCYEATPDLLSECKRAQDELATMLRDRECDFNMLERWFQGVTLAINKAEGK